MKYLINEFGKKHNLKEDVRVHFVEDQLQKTETNTCGIFQLYFFVNLFNPDENSVIIEDKTHTKKTIEKLLMKFSQPTKKKMKKKKKKEKKRIFHRQEANQNGRIRNIFKKHHGMILHLLAINLHLLKIGGFRQV